MRKAVIVLEQQSWLGGAQRVLEATLESIATDYDCIVGFPERGSFRSALEERKVETLDFPIGHYKPGAKSLLEMATFAWRSLYCGVRLAAVILRNRRIVLVYINGPRCLPAGVLAACLTGRPAIFHLHLVLARKPEVLLARTLAYRVSRILACSNAAAAALVGRSCRLAAKTEVLYNPLREGSRTRHTAITSRSDPKHFTIGMVGRITEIKGHHLLLQAIAELPPRIRNKIKLLIVGSVGPGCDSDRHYARNLRIDATRHGLDGQILWTGYQSDPRPFYAAMDVLVHPALAEAMCIAILEALDAGIPIIAARTGGIPEVVRDGFNGMLISLEDRRALGQALTMFIENRGLREHLRSGARCGLDHRFSIETFSAAIRTVVGQLCPPEDSTETQALTEEVKKL